MFLLQLMVYSIPHIPFYSITNIKNKSETSEYSVSLFSKVCFKAVL